MTSLTSTQLGEWVFNALETRAHSTYEKKLRLERIRFLMEQGADPAWTTDQLADGATRSHRGYTLGMAAAYCLDADAITLLASFNVDLSVKDSNNMTPMLYALQYSEDSAAAPGIAATVSALIAGNADVQTGQPIINAASGGLHDIVKALVAAGADVNAENSWGETALVAAVAKQKLGTVKTLIAMGANPIWVSKKTGKSLSDFANLRAKDGDDGVLIAQAIDNAVAQHLKKKPNGPKP